MPLFDPISEDNAQSLPAPIGTQLDYSSIQLKAGWHFAITIPGSQAATATNYSYLMIPRWPIEVLRVTEIHETKASNAGAVTLDVVRVNDGSAISTGVSVLATTFNLKSTDATMVKKEGKKLSANRQILQTQSLALIATGTLTDLAGVNVTIYYKLLGRGDYK